MLCRPVVADVVEWDGWEVAAVEVAAEPVLEAADAEIAAAGRSCGLPEPVMNHVVLGRHARLWRQCLGPAVVALGAGGPPPAHGAVPVSAMPDPRQGVNFGPWRASFPLVRSFCFMLQTGQASRALRSAGWALAVPRLEKF
jgi:hypothetical protein